MSDDRMLRSKDVDPLERELLRAGAEERPSDDARARTLAALGITGLGAATAAGAASTAVTPRGRAGLARIAKWTGLAVAIAFGVGLGWRALRPSAPSASVTPPTASAVMAAPAAASADETASAAQVPVPASVPPSTTASAPKRAAATPAASQDTGLAAEVAALDRAREALASGDAGRALRSLDDYRRSFPNGVLGQEAAVLRIEALVKSGNRAGARTLADRFLAANPSSPHAPRIRHLVGEEDPP